MHRIVEALDDAGRAGVTEIADSLGRPPSVVHDYLSTLVQLGYAVTIDQKYELSLRYLELGGHVRDRLPLYEVAKPEYGRLAEESSSEHVTLSVEEEGMCVAIDVVQSDQSITYNTIPVLYFTSTRRKPVRRFSHITPTITSKQFLTDTASLRAQRIQLLIERNCLKNSKRLERKECLSNAKSINQE